MKADVEVFRSFVDPFQRILRLATPTKGNIEAQNSSDTDPSSRQPPQHITYVTQTFRNATTLVHLMASAILVGWYEAVARDPTSDLYRLTRGFLHTLGGRTETISVLGGVVRLTAPTAVKSDTRNPRAGPTGGAGNEKVNVRWPPYVMAVARAMMARQITLPLGVMGLMNCVFGSSVGKKEGGFRSYVDCQQDLTLVLPVIDMRKLEYLAMCISTPVNESLEVSSVLP